THICRLERHAGDVLLYVQIVGNKTAILKMRIRGLGGNHCRSTAGLAVRRGQIHIACEVHGQREWWVVAQRSYDVCDWLVEIHTGAGADRGLSFSKWVICESSPRSEIAQLAVVWPVDAIPDGNDFVLSEIENAEPVVNLVRNSVVCPAQAQIPG